MPKKAKKSDKKDKAIKSSVAEVGPGSKKSHPSGGEKEIGVSLSHSLNPLDSEKGGILDKVSQGPQAELRGGPDKMDSPLAELIHAPEGKEETFSFEEEGAVTEYVTEEKEKKEKKEKEGEKELKFSEVVDVGKIGEIEGEGKMTNAHDELVANLEGLAPGSQEYADLKNAYAEGIGAPIRTPKEGEVEGIPGLPEGPGSPEFPKGSPELPDGGPKGGLGKEFPIDVKKAGSFWKSYGVVGVKGSTGGGEGDLQEKKEYGSVSSDRGKGHISKGKGTWGALGSVDV
tara:strand:- start:21 stop:878 length:858 start_codon:yes stop_codon:yes gene_type:complete